MGRTPALIALAFAASCGAARRTDDAGTHVDVAATPDAGIDADLVNYNVTGSYLDWDSTAAAPCPIAGATWAAIYNRARVARTDSIGVFTIQLASNLAELDVVQPVSSSSCTTPPSSYMLPAYALVPGVIHHEGGVIVMRSLTAARAATFYAQIGEPFDASRGQLFVHLDGPMRALSISSPHAAVQAFDGTTWAPGATGTDVFVPNIDLTETASTTVTVAGGAIGTGSVTLPAGTITYLTVITN